MCSQAINDALSDRGNIKRYSNTTMIMDECQLIYKLIYAQESILNINFLSSLNM